MGTANTLEQQIKAGLPVAHFELENESHRHSGPATDSHFKMVVVSEAFDGLRPVQRHQKVYALVKSLMPAPVHALALHTYTPEEWVARNGEVNASPNCRGGSKTD